MLVALTLFIKDVFGWITLHWKLCLYIIAGIVVFIVLIFAYKGCTAKKQIAIDQVTVDKINTANEKDRKAELQKVIENNQTVIQTVDNRTVLNDINAVEKNREIDQKVKAADAAIQKAKSDGHNVTQEELNEILTQ